MDRLINERRAAARMPNITSDAWIKCPYFLKQIENEKKALYCCPIFENQKSTKIIFNTSEDKDEHIKNFCATGSIGAVLSLLQLEKDLKLMRKYNEKLQ